MNKVYEWALGWIFFHLSSLSNPTPDDVMRLAEDTLRDYDVEHPDELTDDQWDDLFVALCETVAARVELEDVSYVT